MSISSLDPDLLLDDLRRHVTPDAAHGAPAGALRAVDDVDVRIGLKQYRAIRDEILSFVKSGRTAIPLESLKAGIVAYAMLLSENRDVVAMLKNPRAGEAAHMNALAELIFTRVRAFMAAMCHLDPRKAAQRLKFRVQKLAPDAATKAILSQGIDAIRTWDDYRCEVDERLPRLLEARRVEPLNRQKIAACLRSGLDDCRKVDSLWREWFLPRSLEPWQRLYRSTRTVRREVPFYRTILKEITETRAVMLYPVKDWLDYMKGAISSDCTDAHERAARHLLTPEFFNMRMYDRERWIGNTYCLDLSEQTGDLVVDHVQMPTSFDCRWVDFFPVLCAALASAADRTAVRRILLPNAISNHQRIRDAFDLFLARNHRLRKVNNMLAGEKDLRGFESAAVAQWFVVAWERGAG